MGIRNFSDRREQQPRPRNELRNKLALEHHITVEHGNSIPASGEGTDEVSHAWLRYHHGLMHESEFDLQTVPHRHD